MSHRLVDELGDQDDGGDDTDDETDGADDDVEVGEGHDVGDAEEEDEEGENKKTNTNDEMYGDQSHYNIIWEKKIQKGQTFGPGIFLPHTLC